MHAEKSTPKTIPKVDLIISSKGDYHRPDKMSDTFFLNNAALQAILNNRESQFDQPVSPLEVSLNKLHFLLNTNNIVPEANFSWQTETLPIIKKLSQEALDEIEVILSQNNVRTSTQREALADSEDLTLPKVIPSLLTEVKKRVDIANSYLSFLHGDRVELTGNQLVAIEKILLSLKKAIERFEEKQAERSTREIKISNPFGLIAQEVGTNTYLDFAVEGGNLQEQLDFYYIVTMQDGKVEKPQIVRGTFADINPVNENFVCRMHAEVPFTEQPESIAIGCIYGKQKIEKVIQYVPDKI